MQDDLFAEANRPVREGRSGVRVFRRSGSGNDGPVFADPERLNA
jgi:hypothetical protein